MIMVPTYGSQQFAFFPTAQKSRPAKKRQTAATVFRYLQAASNSLSNFHYKIAVDYEYQIK